MSYVAALRSLGDGAEYAPEARINLAPGDGRPVEMRLDLERLCAERPGLAWYHPEHRSMWRFGGLLALDADDPADRVHIPALPAGGTPLLPWNDQPLARRAGFRLALKDEGLPHPGFGHNATRSFKDRGIAMAVGMACKLGIGRLAIPTQGNAGDALATFGLAAGLEVAVVMPRATPSAILANVRRLADAHASVHLEVVDGTIREAGQRVRERWVPDGWFDVSTFRDPGWRIEGKKTMGLEIAEPRAPGGPWRLPDVVVYPTGGGTGVLGMWKAFEELEALGLVGSERPRMVCVQSAATAPLVEAFARGDAEVAAVEPGETVAVGLNVAGGVGHFRVLQIVRASEGAAVAVEDEALLRALREARALRPWSLAPEGAACLAALPHLVERELVRPGDAVVVFNTAALEKYLPDLEARLRL